MILSERWFRRKCINDKDITTHLMIFHSSFINEYTLLDSFMGKSFNIKRDILNKNKLIKGNYKKYMDS